MRTCTASSLCTPSPRSTATSTHRRRPDLGYAEGICSRTGDDQTRLDHHIPLLVSPQCRRAMAARAGSSEIERGTFKVSTEYFTPLFSTSDHAESEEGITQKISRTFTREPRPESSLDNLMCAAFARQQCGYEPGCGLPSKPPAIDNQSQREFFIDNLPV